MEVSDLEMVMNDHRLKADKELTMDQETTDRLMDEAFPNLHKNYDLRFELSEDALKEIQALDGVAYAYIDQRYTLKLKRGGAFTWDEVEPPITEILAKSQAERS